MDEKAAQDLLHERSFIGRSMHSTLLANERDPEIRFDTKKQIAAFTSQICEVIVDKTEAVKLAVACLLARGHLLIEDIPGVGSTNTIASARSFPRPLLFSASNSPVTCSPPTSSVFEFLIGTNSVSYFIRPCSFPRWC